MPAEQTNTTPVPRASHKADTVTHRSFRFPGTVNTIHQTGADLSTPRPGINVRLLWQDGQAAPGCAEVFSDDCEEYAALGLWFDAAGLELEDFDGAFELPRAVACALRFSGYRVGADFTGEEEPAPAEILPIALLDAIDAFPILREYRAGIAYSDAGRGRAYIESAVEFINGAIEKGDGAIACVGLILSMADMGSSVGWFSLANLRNRCDSAHKAAAVRVLERWMMKGGF